ncbi:MAG: hypothetical protein VW362_12240 [Candidatus Nanopelagicales bacterium]
MPTFDPDSRPEPTSDPISQALRAAAKRVERTFQTPDGTTAREDAFVDKAVDAILEPIEK